MLLTQLPPSTYSLSRHLCFFCLVALSYCFLTAFSFSVFWLIPMLWTVDSFFLGLSLKLHIRKGMIRRISPIKRRTHLWEEQCRTTKQPVSDSSGSVTHPWFQQLGLGVGGQVVQSLMTLLSPWTSLLMQFNTPKLQCQAVGPNRQCFMTDLPCSHSYSVSTSFLTLNPLLIMTPHLANRVGVCLSGFG